MPFQPFQFQYLPQQTYQSPYVQAIAEAMGGPARAQAQDLLAEGAAHAQMGQTVSATLADLARLPEQIQRQKLQGLQAQNIQSEITDRNAKSAQLLAGQKASAAVDRIMATSMKEDPQTGVRSFDRSAFEHSLIQSGQGHLYPQYAETLDKLDASASKRNAEGRKMIAETLIGISKAGYTPDAVLAGAAFLKANGAITDTHLAPVLAAMTSDPSPANIQHVVTQLGNALPEYGQLVDADKAREAGLAKTTAETARATAESQKIAAEVAGTLPANPAQKAEAARNAETARHNVEMERIDRLKVGREQAAQAETARHNRANEAAANPLAALMAPSGAAAAGAAPGAPTGTGGTEQPPQITGEDFAKTLPPTVASQVKALAEGRMQFPGGFALKSPYWQSMIQMVSQYDPSFDTTNYNARNKTRTDLLSPSGTGGKTIGALNTAIQHAGRLSDLIEALGNNDIPAANYVANMWNKQTGGTKVTNFEAVQPQLMKEIERAWRGSGGSQTDIDALKSSLGPNAGIQQQREALDQFVGLMRGKLETTETQRDNALGPIASAHVPVLFEQSKPILDKISARAAGATTEKPAAKVGDIKYLPNGQKVKITFIDPKGNATVKSVP